MSEREFCFTRIYVADREITFCVFLICYNAIRAQKTVIFRKFESIVISLL